MRAIPLPFILAAATALSALAAAPPESGAMLAREGRTRYVITVADNAAPPEHTAARELRDYLGKATGAAFPIVSPAAAGTRPVIAVGPDAAAAIAPELDLERTGDNGLGNDGILLKTVGESLVLTGAFGSRRGTPYAVYEFLERHVGVRWWTADEEFVPSLRAFPLPRPDLRYVPPFIYREVFSWGMMPGERHWGYDDSDAAAMDWAQHRFAARLRNNGHGTAMPASLGGCIMPLGWCHTFYALMPPETYFGPHPEWYSEIDGTRTAERAQLCMTNEAMLEELARNLLARIREQPHLEMAVLTMNDWHGNCQCQTCKTLDDAEGSAMGSLLYGVNKVAAEVEKEFPGFPVATHAYIYARKPPKTIRPRDNVLIWFCVIERSATEPIDSDANRALMDDLRAWSAAAPKLFVWDYTMNLSGPFAPHPNLHVFAPDFRTYRENHAVGVFCEGESTALTHAVEAKVYVMAHLLWDPDRDADRLLDEFLAGYYGPAAAEIGEWYALLRREATGTADVTWHTGPDASWLDLDAMNRGTELFRRAEAAVADDPARAARVRRARLALDHQWLHDYGRYRREAEYTAKPFAGPDDGPRAARDLRDYILREIEKTSDRAMTGIVASYLGVSYPEHVDRLARRASTPLAPLPPSLAALPAGHAIDMDESLASVFGYAGASVVEDPKASNGLTMRVPQADQPSWAVQAKTKRLDTFGGLGRYRVYAVARYERLDREGPAFVGGVWDGVARRSLGDVSFPIGTGEPPKENPGLADAGPHGLGSLPDGSPVEGTGYRTYDFGAYDLANPEISVWVGTVTGDLYVDRFFFVREPDRP